VVKSLLVPEIAATMPHSQPPEGGAERVRRSNRRRNRFFRGWLAWTL